MDLGIWGRTSTSSNTLLPFASSVDEWTEEHYDIYTLVEMAIGNRKEVTPEEAKEIAFGDKLEQMAQSGDSRWLELIEEYMASDGDIDDLLVDEAMVKGIEKELGEE